MARDYYQFNWEFQLASIQYTAVVFSIRILLEGNELKRWDMTLTPMDVKGDTYIYEASPNQEIKVQFSITGGVREGEYVDMYGYWWNSDGVSITKATYTIQAGVWVTHTWLLGSSQLPPPVAEAEEPADWLQLLTGNVLGLHARLSEIVTGAFRLNLLFQPLGSLLTSLMSIENFPKYVADFFIGIGTVTGRIALLVTTFKTWLETGQIPEPVKSISDFTLYVVDLFMAGVGERMADISARLVEPLNLFFGKFVSKLMEIELTKVSEGFRQVYRDVFATLRTSLEYKPPATFEKAELSVTKYLDILFTFTNIGGLASLICDSIGNITILGTKLGVRGLGRWVSSIYWNLGLGWLTWSIFSPIIRASITDPLNAYYNMMYRPKVFTVSEVEEGVLNGLVTLDEYEEILKAHGYNTDSIRVMEGNLLTKISDKIVSLKTQIIDLQEDIVKIDTITLPDLNDKVEKAKESITVIQTDIENKKSVELGQLDASYIPKLSSLKSQIDKVRQEQLALIQPEINKLQQLAQIEIEKIEKLKALTTDVVAIERYQIRQWEITQETQAKINALTQKAEEQANIKVANLIEQFNKLNEEYQAKKQLILKKYEDELNKRTYKLKYDIERYSRQIEYYETTRKAVLNAKITRLQSQLNRLMRVGSILTEDEIEQRLGKISLQKKKLLPFEEKKEKE